LSYLQGVLSNAWSAVAGRTPQAHPRPRQQHNNAAQPAHYSTTEPGTHLYNTPTWLLLMKTEGQRFGYGRYTNSIQIGTKPLSAHVNDPAMLREILALRHEPGLQQKLADGYKKSHHIDIPHVIYTGENTKPNGGIASLQRDLQTLGFDIGSPKPTGINNALTQASLTEFVQQTRPPIAPGTVPQRLAQAAHEAVADAQKYAGHNINMTPAVAHAIRNGANATGMHYSYLMQTAQRESSFDPNNSPSPGDPDSVLGLYQMKPMTWIGLIKLHGEKYGLGNLAHQITGANGYWHLKDKTTFDYAQTLRTDPRLNALLGAELQNDQRMMLPASLRDDDGALYAMQLLGATDAKTYNHGLANTPNAPAAAALPSDVTHGTNYSIFYDGSAPKSFAQVNAGFNASFDADRIFEPKQPTVMAKTRPKKPDGSTPL
jgi:hypothetical protein